MDMIRAAFVAAPLALAAAGGGCSLIKPDPPPDRTPGCMLVTDGFGPKGKAHFRVETVVTGLEVPWALAFLPDGDWLVTERPGRVRLIRDGALIPEPVVTLDVAREGEAGLLGIAVSPFFQADHAFYVYATVLDPGPRNRVLRYVLSPDHRAASLDKVILDGIPAAEYHDGGRLRFGPDGMLYVSTGDARDPARAQAPSSLGGKLLRLTPEGAIPPDNPHGPGSPVFLSGLRNCQGFDWLPSHFLAVADHGPTGEFGLYGFDELNITLSGANLGWPDVHGCMTLPGKAPPALAWQAAVPPAGVARYDSDRIPEWTGSLMIATLGSKHLHRVVYNEKDPPKIVLHEVYLLGDPPSGYGRLREAVMGPGADLYLTTSNCDGRGECPPDGDRILRITP